MRVINSSVSAILLCAAVTGCSAASEEQPGQGDPANKGAVTEGSSADVQALFTSEGEHPEEAIVQLIEEAKSSLDIAVYSISYEPVVTAIIDAADRGVQVRLITDRGHAEEKGKQKKALKRIREAGVPVKVNAHQGKMHLKMLIADHSRVEAGSMNYLESSARENDDVALIIKDAAVAAKFEQVFSHLWDDAYRFTDWSG
ncbi:phosphatidylserine/phosphatidylglycerophosphate/cardiolipin synthase-like enzyme [Paenibacillus rhizosphaerae]|uniref:phospholipase D n=1 Tax=Paenibacillus rhizosphaerae TaxID=297318 RepID=A0A839TUB9_9BACL|nr:phospholipase D-like domain-containing protein [Paenibacillus rhizosphaerae]MBB3129018.1 phosphatidylserine/phosphatidylglycerophosphate/cardiolipin synthase-like enzyme [Paenibacillus rhizosphaerae]